MGCKVRSRLVAWTPVCTVGHPKSERVLGSNTPETNRKKGRDVRWGQSRLDMDKERIQRDSREPERWGGGVFRGRGPETRAGGVLANELRNREGKRAILSNLLKSKHSP